MSEFGPRRWHAAAEAVMAFMQSKAWDPSEIHAHLQLVKPKIVQK